MVGIAPFGMALGGDGATAADPPDPPTHALWQHHYRRYKNLSLRLEGGYVGCPTYSQRYPSSAGLTVNEAATSLTRDVTVGDGALMRILTLKQPRAEAEAMARPIPNLEVGEYCHVLSVEIERIVGDDPMVVSRLHLINADALNRSYRSDRDRLRGVPNRK